MAPSLLWWFACAGPDPGTERACVGSSDLQHATTVAINTAHEGCGRVVLAVDRVVGEGAFSVTFLADPTRVIPQVTSTADGSVLRGLVLVGKVELAGDAPLRVWRQPYAARGSAGVADAGPVALAEGVPVLGGADPDATGDRPGTSWWGGLVGRADGASAVLGATSARAMRVAVAFDDQATAWVVWGHGEAIPLDAGGSVVLDGLYTAVGADPNALLRGWADKAATVSGVALPGVPPPVGWTSGPAFGAEVGEDDVRANLAAAADAGLGLLHVDDGWATAWGEWTANERFPSGTAALATEVAAAGLTPSLSIAPFHAARTAAVYLDHPDWFLRGPDGAELDDLGHAVLDVTHPDAAAWVGAEVAARVGEGWRRLELERAEAVSREAMRATPATGLAAYATALALVRDAAGPGPWIAVSDAPWLPSAGLADSVATGPEPSADPEGRRAAALATAARGFANGRLFHGDPGAVLAGAPLDATEAHGSVVAGAVAGGSFLIGDDLSALPADRLALAIAASGAAGADVRPDDPLAAEGVPVRWTFDLGWTGLLSLGDDPVEVEGPGGTERLDGEAALAGPRTLAPGDGEIWE